MRRIRAAAAAKLLQSCPTLCDPIDSSPPGSPVPGILQARTLEWVAISFSSAWKWKVKVKSFSHVWLLATPWTATYQAPLSLGFYRQEYWSRVPLPSPHDGISLSLFVLLFYLFLLPFNEHMWEDSKKRKTDASQECLHWEINWSSLWCCIVSSLWQPVGLRG